MKNHTLDLLITALAPMVWGSTYSVTTAFLPGFSPMAVAVLRALPAGMLLLIVARQLPKGIWWERVFVLGALNFSFFWAMLFVSAYRLPGGVAATVGAVQPLIVIFLARVLLGTPIRAVSLLAALIGLFGVALLVLTPKAALDPVGVAAGVAGAASMACGTVLTRRWQPPVSPLVFTAWQLTAGGILLLPPTLFFSPLPPVPSAVNVLALVWLGLVGAALTYIVWFRGIARLETTVVSLLGFLSPVTAVLLGWVFLHQALTLPQAVGFALTIGSIGMVSRAQRQSD